MRRETLFSDKSQAKNWISESDVDFFTGGAALLPSLLESA